MEKDELIGIIDNEFKPQNYKRKGAIWKLTGDRIIKIIQLQRSSYSKLYSVNYGFNFVNLNYDQVSMHIFRRLGSFDKAENERIRSLLDFENAIDDETRKLLLADTMRKILKPELDKINSETDVLEELKVRPILLNTLPLKVKEYLNV